MGLSEQIRPILSTEGNDALAKRYLEQLQKEMATLVEGLLNMEGSTVTVHVGNEHFRIPTTGIAGFRSMVKNLLGLEETTPHIPRSHVADARTAAALYVAQMLNSTECPDIGLVPVSDKPSDTYNAFHNTMLGIDRREFRMDGYSVYLDPEAATGVIPILNGLPDIDPQTEDPRLIVEALLRHHPELSRLKVERVSNENLLYAIVSLATGKLFAIAA